MTGFKFKVAHKRAGSEKWSTSDNARRKRLVKFLHELIDSIEGGEEESLAEPVVEASAPVQTAAKTRKRLKKPVKRRRARASTV
jgi:hypothetical protein